MPITLMANLDDRFIPCPDPTVHTLKTLSNYIEHHAPDHDRIEVVIEGLVLIGMFITTGWEATDPVMTWCLSIPGGYACAIRNIALANLIHTDKPDTARDAVAVLTALDYVGL